MARTSDFQSDNESSILSTRTKILWVANNVGLVPLKENLIDLKVFLGL